MRNKTASAFVAVAFVVALTLLSVASASRAQPATAFTPNDQFPIPKSNGTITFGLNGNYSSATLEGDTWVFRDLQMEHPQSYLGFDLNGSQGVNQLGFSTKNTNVTIWACLSFYYTLPVHSIVYYAQGVGTQTVNLGLDSSDSDPTEWSIIVGDNVFLAEGEGWTIASDGTITVEGLVGNVTIAHFELGAFEKNMLFYLEHSVAILTGLVLATVIVVATVVRLKIKKKSRL